MLSLSDVDMDPVQGRPHDGLDINTSEPVNPVIREENKLATANAIRLITADANKGDSRLRERDLRRQIQARYVRSHKAALALSEFRRIACR
jgi:hypothetical protein